MSAPSGRTSSGAGLPGRLVAALLAFALVVTGLALLGGGAAVAEEAASGPSITSDQADYPPGALVTLTGAGWQAGEPVHVTVNDDQGRTWQRDADLVADDAGAVTDSFNLPDWFVATYKVTATGAASGVVTSWFTDGNIKVATLATSGGTTQLVTAGVSYGKYPNASGCGTTTPSSISAVSGGATIPGGVGPGDYVLLTAPATVSDPAGVHTFQGWSVEGEQSSGDQVFTRCVAGVSGSKTATARYSLGVPTTTATTTAVSTSGSPTTYGDQVTLTAKVSPSPSGAGTVTFTDGSTTLCANAPLSGDTATCKTSGLAAGSHTVTASYSGATGFTASNGNVAQTVAQKQVTGSFTAADKVYDGTRTATISGRSLTGLLTADAGNVTLKDGTATFDTAAAGPGKTVTGTGFTLDGAAAANYVLASATLTTTAKIGQQGVTLGFGAANKEYDGTTAATITSRSIDSGILAGDDLTVSGGTAVFGSKNVGTGKTVTASDFVLGGAAKDNYVVTSVASTTASITAKPVTGSFTASGKTYDRTVTATVTGRSLNGVVGRDDVSLEGGTATFDNRNAGTDLTVTLTGASLTGSDAGNYDLRSVATTTANITAKQITGRFTVGTKVYDGNTSATIDTRTLSDVIDGDTVSLTGGTAFFADKNAGPDKAVNGSGFTLAGADAANYALQSGDLSTTAAITPRQVTGSFSADNKVYDGNTSVTVQTPSLSGAITGDHVSLAVNNAGFGTKNVGDAKTVTGTLALTGEDAGNYTLSSATGTTTANITARHVTGTFTAANKTYDATTEATVLTRALDNAVTGDDVRLTGGTASFADASVGTGKIVTLSGAALSGDDAGNFVLDSVDTTTASIGARALEVTADPQTKVYGETDPSLTYTVTKGELKGTDTLTGSPAREAGEDVGSYAITLGDLSAGGNYALTFVPGDLEITRKALTVTTNDDHRTYGEPNPGFRVSYEGFVRGDDSSDLGGSLAFSTDADQASPVGPYDVTPSGLTSHNYDIEFVAGTLTVDKRDLTITADDAQKTYGDDLALGTTAFGTDGLTNGDQVTSVTLHSAGAAATAPAGGYPIVASEATGTGLGNYAITYADGTLGVEKAPLTITADDRTKVYGDVNPDLTGSITGVKNDDKVSASYSTAATQLSAVGGYPIVPAAVGDASVLANYDVTPVNGNLSVTQRPLTIRPAHQDKTYGQNLDLGNTSFTADGLANSDSVATVTLTSNGAAATASVGSYDITATDAVASAGTNLGNYRVSYDKGTLTVKPKALTVTATGRSKTYGDELPLGTTAFTTDGLVNGDTVSGVTLTSEGAPAAAAVGSYDVVPSAPVAGDHTDLGNYTIGFVNGSLTVNQASLSIKADDKTKVYGDPNPALTGTVTGVKNGDKVSASYSTRADQLSGVGGYPIVPAAVGDSSVLANYDITPVNGTLSVTPRSLTIVPSNQGKTYGQSLDLGSTSFAADGLANGDKVASVTLASDGAAAGAPVGRYDITASGVIASSGTSLGNYAVTYGKGTLTVQPKGLTITARPATKVLGDVKTFTGTEFDATGLVNGDTVASVTLTSDGSAATAPVGSYPIVASAATGQGLSNYAITYTIGTLTVLYRWDGYLQPINDTAHQIGTSESKFKLGQTIPAKFVLKNASGNVVQQSGSPVFSKRMVSTSCDSTTSTDSGTSDSASAGGSYVWNGSQYQYNWSTKGLQAGEYQVYAGLADGTQQSVYICLTK